MCIGGAGLARAYLNQPELTAAKFVNVELAPGQTTRVYRSGDLARWLPDGNLDFRGRKDTQVKIRGHRIELEEIEQVLNTIDEVKASVVLARDLDTGSLQLVAYYIPEGDCDSTVLEAILTQKLPDYMVPKIWVKLDEFPMTSNNKVNRRILPLPEIGGQSSDTYLMPSTPTEIALAKIWEEVLKLERVGLTDNFFAIGGQSLLAMRVTSAIRNSLNKELEVKAFFSNPTIKELGQYLDKAAEEEITTHGGPTTPPTNPTFFRSRTDVVYRSTGR